MKMIGCCLLKCIFYNALNFITITTAVLFGKVVFQCNSSVTLSSVTMENYTGELPGILKQTVGQVQQFVITLVRLLVCFKEQKLLCCCKAGTRK